MKIAISGVHGQGKTTILNALKDIEIFKDFTFVDSPTRALIGTHSINEAGTQDTQAAIMFQHYINQINDNVIVDRCALDGMAYTTYFTDQISLTIYSVLRSLYLYLINRYDIIFYIEPELELVSDGTRSINLPFFEAVKNNFEYLIRSDKIKVVSVQGTVEQRIKKIVDTYNVYRETHKK